MDEIYKGVFWFLGDLEKLLQEAKEENFLFFLIPCDNNGTVNVDFEQRDSLNAKSGNTYNHKALWKTLSNKLTQKHSYQYYPRGRVEIRNGKAYIYLNPILNTDHILSALFKKFKLSDSVMISAVQVKSDYSTHYFSHYDDLSIQ